MVPLQCISAQKGVDQTLPMEMPWFWLQVHDVNKHNSLNTFLYLTIGLAHCCLALQVLWMSLSFLHLLLWIPYCSIALNTRNLHANEPGTPDTFDLYVYTYHEKHVRYSLLLQYTCTMHTGLTITLKPGNVLHSLSCCWNGDKQTIQMYMYVINQKESCRESIQDANRREVCRG